MKQKMGSNIARLIILSTFIWSPLICSDTSLYLYRPFAGSKNHPALKINNIISGECGAESQVINRADAWRCYHADRIYDPCFVKRFGTQTEAICAESPWSDNAVKIKLGAPLNNIKPDSFDMSRTYPWAIELEQGDRCLAYDHKEVVDNLPVKYQCQNGSYLIGYIQRCKATWQILQFFKNGSSTVKIAKAWF